MKIEANNPETGKKFQAESAVITSEFLKSLQEFEFSDESLKRVIDNLDISADGKAIIFSISKATIKVGEFIIEIGRKIVEIVIRFSEEYPGATFGMLLGAILTALVSAIPVIGVVLGSMLGSLLVILGLGVGYVFDFANKAIDIKIKSAVASLSPLAAQ